MIKNTILNKILIPALGIPFLAFTIITLYTVSFSSENIKKIKNTYAQGLSSTIIDKIDRNYYERFGDVQAFAYNPTTLEALNDSSKLPVLTDFMNTMTSYYVLYDLMMVVDSSGNVVAFNTQDKNKKALNTTSILKGKKFSGEDWFLKAKQGPEGGAWYSDFQANEYVAAIDNDNAYGYGVAFVSPIYGKDGRFKGVWYNYSSWLEITQKIRTEASVSLHAAYPNSEIIITDKDNKIIDADNQSKIQKGERINLEQLSKANIVESFMGKGAYTYKGNGWKAFVIIEDQSSLFIILKRHFVLIFICFCSLTLVLFTIFYITKTIVNKLKSIRNSVATLAQGELQESTIYGEEEINQMTWSINELVKSLSLKSIFAEKIGQGDLQASYAPSSEKDVLGKSLVSMRENLFHNAEEEKRRNWTNESLNKISEILRNNSEMAVMCDAVLKTVVKLTNSLQGAIYILSETSEGAVLKLVSCYAFDRKKYLNTDLILGEGLVGQVFLEKESLYLSEIPDSLTISSGLGMASPKFMLIVPLNINGETNGVLQIASFKPMEDFIIKFVEKVAENLALSINNSRVSEKTQKLLIESQIQAEQLKSQEEEMRQNMEELSATQEEMERKEREYIQKINTLEKKNRMLELQVQ